MQQITLPENTSKLTIEFDSNLQEIERLIQSITQIQESILKLAEEMKAIQYTVKNPLYEINIDKEESNPEDLPF